MSRSFYQDEDWYQSETGWNAGLGALTIDGGGNVGVPTSRVSAAAAAVGTGPLLGNFDGKPCYGVVPGGAFPGGANQCSQGTSICSYKCRFAQCVNSGLLPASYCGQSSTQQCPAGTTLQNGQCLPNTTGPVGTSPTGGGPTAGCPAGYSLVSGQCVLNPSPSNPLTCTSPYVPNSAGTQCVLPVGATAPGAPTCTGYFVLNTATNTCVLSCPTGYTVDPTGTTCDAPGTVTSTTGTSLGSELETFFANYWLYILIGLGAYLLLKKK
jgi:hypothetical protein